MTKEIERRLEKFPLYSQDGKGKEATVVVKFFNPYGSGTWYVLEGQKEANGDYTFFGLVDLNGIQEYGYFTLSELEAIKINCFGYKFPLERDKYFTPTELGKFIS